MAIDIFSIQPHEVSRDLCGYTFLLYGAPKTGKTTIASQFPDTLLLAFETGYLAIPGIIAQPINKWSEFKQVLKQLKENAGPDSQFKNVVIDTADIAYDLCEKYICNQNNVNAINEIPYGQGWAKASKEFDEALRSIPQMGYGLVMISHSQDKTFKDDTGAEYDQIVPTLANRPRNIVDRMSDIIGYAHPTEDEEGDTHTILYMRGTPRFIAGSRFKYTPDYIDFSYENLVNAIGDAIDAQAKETGGKFVTDERTKAHDLQPERSFSEVIAEFKDLCGKIQDAAGSDFKDHWAPAITEITNKYLGVGHKASDATPEQVDQIELINGDLKDLLANGIDA